ncbi:hypothetical protein HYW43_02510 [Candidatus Daviesbacteria bacterium]|nr:hypothetical protein [Candidatus Daviesbacteria bacterium]
MNKKIHIRKDIVKIFSFFIFWRIILIIIMFLAIKFIPVGSTDKFLGGGYLNYHIAPEIFSWANFDGEHYLSISIFGYKGLEQAFFPVFPALISFFAKPFSEDLFSSLLSSTIVGIFISNISLILALIFLFDLISLDYSKKIAFFTIVILLLFPTSFYFGAVYNESLFLLLSVLSFYCARKNKWFLSSVFGSLSAVTRVFGILLFPALLIEAYKQKVGFPKAVWLILIPFGLGLYMTYLYLTVGDPIAFYTNQRLVGEQHQPGFTLLPQVYFRYIKMIFTVDNMNPIYQTIWLEFVTGLLFLALPVYGYFKKIRLSYLFFALAGFILPTIQGSLSSTPRYILILFPSFLALVLFLNNLPRIFQFVYILFSAIILAVETALFLRGYWVA